MPQKAEGKNKKEGRILSTLEALFNKQDQEPGMSIRQKFTLLVAFLSTLILVQAMVGYWIGFKAEARMQEMYVQRTQSLAKLGEMLDDSNVIRVRLLRATLAATPEAINTELSQVGTLQENINKKWAEVKNLASSEEEKTLVAQYEATQEKYTHQKTAWIQSLKNGDFEQAKSVAGDKKTTVAFRDSRNAIRSLFGVEDKLANSNFENSRSDAKKAQITLLAIIVLSIFTAILSAQFILKPIASTLQEATALAAEIARGNLSKKIIIKGRDEIAQLMRSLDTMQNTLRESVRIIQHASEELGQQATTIAENANQIHEQAAHQGDAMNSAASAIEELTVSINILSENTEDAHKTTDLAGKEAKEGENTIIATSKQMLSVAETVRKTSKSIEELGSKSKQVNKIVDVIREVADQTNLLALNAAIEAARAGEQGRGFAVVADEVRKLAERTGQSTLEISKVIAEVLGETVSATQEMGLGVKKVEEGTQMAEAAGHSIHQIVTSTDNVISMVCDISNAIREQTTAAQDIAKSVEHVAQMTDEAIAIANANSESANTLKELSRKLSSTVNRFQLE